MNRKFSSAIGAALIAALSLTFSAFDITVARAQGTSDEQADCMSDALRLCGQFVPDRGKITACMIQKKAQLSPACRRHFH